MESMSLAEAVLHGIAEESGVEPDDDLLDRLEATPPAALRRLRRLDGEVLELASVVPLALAAGVTGVLEGVGDDGRVAPDRVWDARESAEGPAEDPDSTVTRLIALAHRVLGLPEDCEECRAALSEPEVEGEDDEQDPHDEGPGLVETVLDVHTDVTDTWEIQVGGRIAIDAGEAMAEMAAFDVLHEVVGHGGEGSGVSAERRADLHAAQHAGMALCVNAAEVQGLRAALVGFATEGGVRDRLDAAERAAVEDGAVIGTLVASVVVDEVAQRVREALDSAPPAAPPRGPARPRRRRR